MTPENFVLWLNGFVEMTDAQAITEKQWKMIKEHLALCTKKVTPTEIKLNVGPIIAEPAKPMDKIDWGKINDKFKPIERGVYPYQPFQPMWLGQQHYKAPEIIC